MSFRTIQWHDGKVVMIDQTRLPAEEVYNEYSDYQGVAQAIRGMIIRGAPAIGVAAAMGVALGARDIIATDHDGFQERAALGVAADVEREDDLGGELATLFQHRVDGVGIEFGVFGDLLQIIHNVEQLVHHKLHVAQRRGVGWHGVDS